MKTLERLTIYVGESDRWQGRNVYMALVEEARKQGLAGTTVTKSIVGYGKRQQQKIQKATLFGLSSDLPMIITIIDSAEAISAFLPLVQEMVMGGIVIQETVNVLHPTPVLAS